MMDSGAAPLRGLSGMTETFSGGLDYSLAASAASSAACLAARFFST
jgi:hypothetical protein